MEDRREFERITTEWPMTISMPGGGDHRDARSLNVSASGVAIEVEGEMLVAGNVQLCFGGEPPIAGIICTARIVWVGSGSEGLDPHARLGLHYLDISSVDRSKLRFKLYGSSSAKKSVASEAPPESAERKKA